MKKTRRRPRPDLPHHIAEAIRLAWPDGVIEMPTDSDEVRFADTAARLRAALSRIPGAAVLYEREPPGGPRWDDTSDPDEDPPDGDAESRSYGLLFVAPTDERFEFSTETTEPDEDGIERPVQGEGRIGYVVAVSAIAPFAAVKLDEIALFGDGSRSEPDVQPSIFSLDGRPVDPDDHYRELLDEASFEVLGALRAEIVRVLGEFSLVVIPREDLERPVGGLRASEEVVAGLAGETVTVRDAFFFRSV